MVDWHDNLYSFAAVYVVEWQSNNRRESQVASCMAISLYEALGREYALDVLIRFTPT